MKGFSDLKKNLKKDFTGLKPVKIAIAGDTAPQFLSQALQGLGFDSGISFDIFEADFNQIENQVFDAASELYAFNPEFVIIFHSTHKLLNKYNKLNADECNSLADSRLALIEKLVSTIKSRLTAKIIYYNYPEIDDSVFGSFANKTEWSFLFQLRKLNFGLMQYASKTPDFNICDIASLQNQFGKITTFRPSIYINTEMVLSIDIVPFAAARTLDIINVLLGNLKKCVILDLDNTLWGGIIGDDGIENIQLGSLGIGKAFSEFQQWLKKLKNRGIILAVCSKNDEDVAKGPFENHPDMVLRLDDIAVFIANWDNKAANIRKIQSMLNIGFDSMVFLDDNPFERNLVRENIPDITIPELPQDPAEYLEYLYALNLFETQSLSAEDAERTKHYQIEQKRAELQANYANEDEFLKSLGMVSVVESFNPFNTPRAAQLSQRSNQFNLRTVRYTETDIQQLIKQQDAYTFSFTLEDKFSDNGLISIVVLKKENAGTLFIESWLMSCRVLKRGMENFILNTISAAAKSAGFKFLKGEYIPTLKNGMVKEHYHNLGFGIENGHWLLNVEKYEPKHCFITKK